MKKYGKYTISCLASRLQHHSVLCVSTLQPITDITRLKYFILMKTANATHKKRHLSENLVLNLASLFVRPSPFYFTWAASLTSTYGIRFYIQGQTPTEIAFYFIIIQKSQIASKTSCKCLFDTVSGGCCCYYYYYFIISFLSYFS